ncbi:hypothetical protein AB205_0148750 [Aquarana catesbeiana]|uniref:Uncharacterized protein n=1 Tax=Aquarana catesbeiana TaxID=8400 RepID=A0A2G9RVX0_AQUCT|nr:hypothetical protein AB205_0148750 [Aquarana catesbeiana]
MFHISIPGLKYLCAKYTFCFTLIGEKRLRQPDPRDPRPRLLDWEISPSPAKDVEEGAVEEVGDMGTPPGDVLVVEEGEPFTTDIAQRLIGQIMAWNGDIDAMRNAMYNTIATMRNRLDNMQQEMKNMINVLGRI